MVPFSVTLSDLVLVTRFQGHAVIFRPMNALNLLCAQLTCDVFAIAKFLLTLPFGERSLLGLTNRCPSVLRHCWLHCRMLPIVVY